MVDNTGSHEKIVKASIDEIKVLQCKARAKERARIAMWDLNSAIFLFLILIIVIVLLFQGIRVEIVGPVAIFGLAMVWVWGWKRGRQMYGIFYEEELVKLKQELAFDEKHIMGAIEETVEEKVQRALRERWQKTD